MLIFMNVIGQHLFCTQDVLVSVECRLTGYCILWQQGEKSIYTTSLLQGGLSHRLFIQGIFQLENDQNAQKFKKEIEYYKKLRSEQFNQLHVFSCRLCLYRLEYNTQCFVRILCLLFLNVVDHVHSENITVTAQKFGLLSFMEIIERRYSVFSCYRCKLYKIGANQFSLYFDIY